MYGITWEENQRVQKIVTVDILTEELSALHIAIMCRLADNSKIDFSISIFYMQVSSVHCLQLKTGYEDVTTAIVYKYLHLSANMQDRG